MGRFNWTASLVLLWLLTGAVAQEPDASDLSVSLLREGAPALARAAREKGDPIRGAILFAQKKINCVGCHAQGTSDGVGPDLTRFNPIEKNIGQPDEYLIEAILLPSKVIAEGYESEKILTEDGRSIVGRVLSENETTLVVRDASAPTQVIRVAKTDIAQRQLNTKSAMPENLASLLETRQEFLDLVRYLMEIAATNRSTLIAGNETVNGPVVVSERLRGLGLLDDYGCVNCHDSNSIFSSAESALSGKRAPDLKAATARIDPDYLLRFIADPLHTKPGTTMPDLMGQVSEAQKQDTALAIADYLHAQTTKTFQRQVIDAEAVSRGQELFHTIGCVACHSPRDERGQETLKLSSVPLGDVAAKYNLEGLVEFLKDPCSIRPSGRMPNMVLTHWEAVDIANYLLDSPEIAGGPSHEFSNEPSRVAAGRRHFQELGCSQCHQDESQREKPNRSISLERVRVDQGCLSDRAGPWPAYSLDTQQKAAMRMAIEQLDSPLQDSELIDLSMHTLRCHACHQRDDVGGVPDERNHFFLTTNENLGPQGRMPPTLNNVGGKLKPKWMRQVLVSGRAIRPYVRTRMPQYGAANVSHLVDLFQRVDHKPAMLFDEVAESREMRKIATELVGDNGLNCVACHTFQQKAAQTMPAVDLTEMAERLHKEWFFQYMSNPQALSPNTVMPSFWPGGKAIRKDVLEGDVGKQIGVIWNYLREGRQAPTPRGLRIEPIELLADANHAVMLRRSYQGIGKRGIGVGYPAGANMAFDAEQIRIGMLWKGQFADPGGVWRGQGHGTVRPLSREVMRFPKGPELDDSDSPWVVDEGRPPRHQFMGYDLDTIGRPTLLYRFDQIAVEDQFLDRANGEDDSVTLIRKLTFHSETPRKNLHFRVAGGKAISRKDETTFEVGETLRIEIDRDHEGQLNTNPLDRSEQFLVVPIDLPAGKSTFTIHYTW